MEKLCNGCGEVKPLEDFHIDNTLLTKRRSRCKDCVCTRTKKYTSRVKLEGIEAYGGKCQCCGESEPDFLTVEHINGRREEDDHVGRTMWTYLKKQGWPKDNYQ